MRIAGRRSPAARTWRDYGYDLRIFVAVVGDRPPGEINFRDVDNFISQQSAQGFKASTINRRLATLVALYAFLAPEDDDLTCPVHPRRHHLREPQRLPRPVAESDLRQFFAIIRSGSPIDETVIQQFQLIAAAVQEVSHDVTNQIHIPHLWATCGP